MTPSPRATVPDHTHEAHAARLADLLKEWSQSNKSTRIVSTPQILLNHSQIRTNARPPTWIGLGPMGHCYRNSLIAAAEGLALGMNLRYVEGYAYSSEYNFALDHAWVEDSHGTVFETTWRPGHARAYIGYSFDVEEAVAAYLHVDAPLLHGDWERGMVFHESHVACCL